LVAGAVSLGVLSTGLGLSISEVAVILALSNLGSIGLIKRLVRRRGTNPRNLGHDLAGPS